MRVGEKEEEEKREKKKKEESNTEQQIKQIYRMKQNKKGKEEGGLKCRHVNCVALSDFLGLPGRRSHTRRNTRPCELLETTLPSRNHLWDSL